MQNIFAHIDQLFTFGLAARMQRLNVSYRYRCLHLVMSEYSSAYFSEIGYDRYKFVVQVVMGEQKGEGVK